MKVRINGDNIVEGGSGTPWGGEIFREMLTRMPAWMPATGICQTQATGTIVDDDSATVTLSVVDSVVSEPDDDGAFSHTQSHQ